MDASWHLLEKLRCAAAVIHGSGSADEMVKSWWLRLDHLATTVISNERAGATPCSQVLR
jgi:hypothetical protein